jgi:hypothetical protein
MNLERLMAKEVSEQKYEVMCVKCNALLWSMRVLSHHADKPTSTEWKSHNPDMYPSKAPKDWHCPLCKKIFCEVTKAGPRIKVVTPSGQRQYI